MATKKKPSWRQPSWPAKQRARLAKLLRDQAKDPATTWLGYWNSDAWGRSANGGGHEIAPAAAGVVHRLPGKDLVICTERGLHATRHPHQWQGARVWVVALLGKRIDQENKSAALTREIVGEVLPRDLVCPMAAARMGIGADLSSANLRLADLSSADLRSANLRSANLSSANLYSADLSSADLSSANLRLADLSSADLRSADLRSANLSSADLSSADLRSADLRSANLSSANLYSADLSSADLSSANLRSADFQRVYIGTIERPIWLPEQWIVTSDGYIARRES